MADESLKALASALQNAAGSGPVTLNAVFIRGASSDLPVPADFDKDLREAWRLGASGSGLQLSFQAGDVGSVSNGQFQVTNARLTQGFLGATSAETSVTCTFELGTGNLKVRIRAALASWSFPKFFTQMSGWLVDQIKLEQTTFLFSSENAADSFNGQSITLESGQNFAGVLTVPDDLKPLFEILGDLGNIPTSLTTFGPIDVSQVDNEYVLYPSMNLKAPLTDGGVDLFFLKAKEPFVGISTAIVPAQPQGEEEPLEPDDLPSGFDASKVVDQRISMTVGCRVVVKDAAGHDIPLILQAALSRGGLIFSFALMPDSTSNARITPDTVIGLMSGNGYLQLVPAPLQQFLTNIGLNGFMVSGSLNPPSLESLSVNLGSVPGTSLVLFGDPTSKLSLVIEDFSFLWTLVHPLDSANRQSLIAFTTEFTLFPNVFRDVDGKPGGKFAVRIDQDFNIEASFGGKVALNDVLREMTAGAIGLPDSVAIEFSDVDLLVNPSAKSYSFGFALDASFDFLTFNGKPLIQFQDVLFELSAITPKSEGNSNTGKTVYSGSLDGNIIIGPVNAIANVQYDGASDPKRWTLHAELAEPLDLINLVNQFFRTFSLPDFLPGNLIVETFSIDADIPSRPAGGGNSPANTAHPSYKVAGAVRWTLPASVLGFELDTVAKVGLAYDGSRPADQRFSGSVIGEISIEEIGVELLAGYRFGSANDDAASGIANTGSGDSTVLWLEWNGFRATYDRGKQTVTFTLRGWTVGSLLEALVREIGNPYFSLDSPWDLLNKIPLDGLALTYNLKKGVANPLSASYTLPSPVRLGFVNIEGFNFKRVGKNVTISIKGSTNIEPLKNSPLFKPDGNGQDVQKMPQVPGRGNKFFDLRLLAMGQRIGIRGSNTFANTKAAIDAIRKVPSTDDGGNPINPTDQTAGQPYYSQDKGWLVATDFGILRDGTGDYTVDLKIVFNDPDLYGLRLALAGKKAKVLAGLVIDILYKKITDDIGVYQIDFSFPSALRQMQFGAFSITLPDIGVKIYTNGDFFIDIGFPYNLDFSRSFTLQGIIFVGPIPVPVLGSAGFYFGKLSNATATNLPQTTKGTFNPVIVFGIGLQFGFGKTINKGPLRAGFSVTVFGIVEGTIAPWHPYEGDGSGTGNSLQNDYYFKLAGTIGILGKLFGVIDFAIIKADVNVDVKLYASIIYESFRAIPVSATASVSVRVSIKIGAGIFSFRIHFSFSARITVNAKLGSDQTAPWDDDGQSAARARLRASMPEAFFLTRTDALTFTWKPVEAPATKPTLLMVPTPQFSVLTPDVKSKDPSTQESAFILLFATDAPAVGESGNRDGSSFQSLCQALLPYLVAATKPNANSTVNLSAAAQLTITADQLRDMVDAFSNNEKPPITADQVRNDFLKAGFTVNVAEPGSGNQSKLQAGAALFPPFNGFGVKIPDPKAILKPDEDPATVTIALGDYTTVTEQYRVDLSKIISKYIGKLEGDEQPTASTNTTPSTDPEPLVDVLFLDYFIMVSRQLLQAAADVLSDYLYTLLPNDSLTAILDWARGRGNKDISLEDIAEPNLTRSLKANLTLSLPSLLYRIQANDSLASIANRYSDPASSNKRWQTTVLQLVQANATAQDLVRPNQSLTISVSGANKTYNTLAGDSLTSVANGFGLSLDVLAANASFQKLTNLLAPTLNLTVPSIAYTTGASDSLASLQSAFSLPLDALLNAIAGVANLFDTGQGPCIRIANLSSLKVLDLWSGILEDDRVAQTAGMVSRYQLHGMRLPNRTGLGLSDDFLYPKTGQPDYGLFQLSGQQWPVPAFVEAADYKVTITKDTSLAWMEMNGDAATTELKLDLTNRFGEASVVLDYARSTGYRPKPAIGVEERVALTPKQFAIQNITRWSPADQSSLENLTRKPGTSPANDGGQRQPLIWQFPSSLLAYAESRQATLGQTLSFDQALPYLPVFQPTVGLTDPASKQTTFAAIDDYAFATRIDFQVKRLAQDVDLAPPTPFANSVVPTGDGNPGGRARELAPFTYELIGPGPADARLLERLLTAMDKQGESMISGLYIAYADSGSAASGLVSHAADDFLSFIIQSNLSTETNPPPASAFAARRTATAPRGVANSRAEFLRLMWELSTVRSGGYYLFYQTVADNLGLPPSLFDDSGSATLTLVVLTSRASEPVNGGRLTNYNNALVSTEAIDSARAVLTLNSVENQQTSQAISSNQSLASLSGFYGNSIGVLADLNGKTPLNANKALSISGVIHQVTSTDVSSGNVFDALATYYSKGAQSPVTAAAIQAFNPGITGALGDAVRIPTFTYVINGSAGMPGNTIEKIAAYYGLTPGAVGVLAQDIQGLFSASTVQVDSILYDNRPTLGLGNSGVALERSNLGDPIDLPANPTSTQKNTYAKAYLYSLYSLLTGGVKGNAFFTDSGPGLSFGPRKSLTPEEAETVRDAAARQQFHAEGTNEPFTYATALGYGDFATVNPAPDPAATDLPAKAKNPYVGIGSVAQIDLRWVDIFGNRTVTSFVDPQSSDTLSGQPDYLGYADDLLGPAQWPNVRSNYNYSGSAGSPVLNLNFDLNTAGYDSDNSELQGDGGNGVPVWRQNALNDKAIYTRAYFQLQQDYDNLKDAQGNPYTIPGLSGRAVSVSVSNSLLATPEIAFSQSQTNQLLQFVSDCLVYVTKRAAGQAGGTVPTSAITMPVAIDGLRNDNIIKLAVSLRLRRQTALVDPVMRGLINGTTVDSVIQPKADGPPPAPKQPPTQDIKPFARSMEGAFIKPRSWQLRIGTSAPDPSQTQGRDNFTVWAVRLAFTGHQGLHFRVDNTASFYAPAPVANQLRTETVRLNNYQTGQNYPAGDPVDIQFSGVDLNVWASSSLGSIDEVLGPNFSSPMFILDRIFFANPEKDGYLAKFLETKRTLAEAIARTVKPILATSDGSEPAIQSASRKMEQALLNRLGSAYTITALVQFPVIDAETNQGPEPGSTVPPRFFGQPGGSIDKAKVGEGAGDNFSLTTAKIPLDNQGGAGKTYLTFLFSSKNISDTVDNAYVPMKLTYALSHLEHKITNVPGIDNYEQSNWIGFATGPFPVPLSKPGSSTDIPVVLRALPRPPTVEEQTFTGAAIQGLDPGDRNVPPGTPPSELVNWDYLFTYIYPAAAQDNPRATSEFNLPDLGLFAKRATTDLFRALAQFTHIQPAVSRDLAKWLTQINAKSTANDEAATNAKAALDAMLAVTTTLATDYDNWSKAFALAARTALPQRKLITFDAVLRDDGGKARIDIFQIDKQPPDVKLPNPEVLLQNDDYQPKPITAAQGAIASYQYTKREGGTLLPYEDALSGTQRGIQFSNLDIFGFQNAQSELQIIRNRFLVPNVATNDLFQFRTPNVKYADALVPLLDYNNYSLDALVSSKANLGDILNTFFRQIFKGASGQTIEVKMEARYSYQVLEEYSDLPRTVLPIVLLPPVEFTARAGVVPDFVDAIATRVSNWFNQHKPVVNSTARLEFSLDIFAGQGGDKQKMPLLRLKNMTISTSKLNLPS